MKLSEMNLEWQFGWTLEWIKEACRMFHCPADGLTVSDITPSDRRIGIPDTNETPQKI